jgi:hypothetical protein
MAEPVSLDELIEECEEALDAANDITDVMEESMQLVSGRRIRFS